MLASLPVALLVFVLMSLPSGYLLGSLCPDLRHEDAFSRLAVYFLLGLCLWPVTLAVATAVHLPLTSLSVQALILILLLAAIFLALWRRRLAGAQAPNAALTWATIAVLGAGLALRVWQVRSVVWPLWGDAVNHTAATMLIARYGTIPPNWQPLIPFSQTFSYHFGFHTWSAILIWVGGLQPWAAVFWCERFLNALAPLSMYLMASALFKDRWAGLGAATMVALLTKTPMYYVNWSRDPQLGGQTLIPLIVYLTIVAFRDRPGRWRPALLAALATAALVFVHYRVLIFALCLAPGALLLSWPLWWRQPKRLLWPAAGVVLGLAVTIPWLWRVFATELEVARLGNTIESPDFTRIYFSLPPLRDYLAWHSVLLAAAGLLLAWRRWPRQLLGLIAWLLCLAVAANGYRLHKPGSNLINYISVFMALYMPFSLAFGAGVAIVMPRLLAWPLTRKWAQPAFVLAALTLGVFLYGNLIQRTFVLVDSSDLAAFSWIESHTPESAKFLVNGFAASGERGTVVGSDAGWWLPLVTGREASVPVINYTTEIVAPAYAAQVRELAKLETAAVLSDTGQSALCRLGFSHIFIGAVGGPLDKSALAASGRYPLLYSDGGAMVFAVNCPR